MKSKNIKLKIRCVQLGISAKMLAEEMELSETQFCRKINHTQINKSIARFTKCERFYLSDRLNMELTDIE